MLAGGAVAIGTKIYQQLNELVLVCGSFARAVICVCAESLNPALT